MVMVSWAISLQRAVLRINDDNRSQLINQLPQDLKIGSISMIKIAVDDFPRDESEDDDWEIWVFFTDIYLSIQ